jgi:hypothetical protein
MHVSQVWCDGNFFLHSALFNGIKHRGMASLGAMSPGGAARLLCAIIFILSCCPLLAISDENQYDRQALLCFKVPAHRSNWSFVVLDQHIHGILQGSLQYLVTYCHLPPKEQLFRLYTTYHCQLSPSWTPPFRGELSFRNNPSLTREPFLPTYSTYSI